VTASATDEWQILRLLERYSWAVGAGDWNEFVALFAPTGTVQLPDEDLVFGEGGTAPLTDLAFHWLHHAESPGRQLWTDATVVELDGDTATAHSFLGAPSVVLSALMEGSHLRFLGRADDELVRWGGEWRFATRVITAGTVGAAVPTDSPAWARDDDGGPADGSGLTPAERLALVDVCADYAWAIDRADVDGAVATFDAEGRITDPEVGFQGTEGLRAFFRHLITDFVDFTGRTHWIGPSTFRRTGDSVRVRSFCLVMQRPRVGSTSGIQLVMEYDDQLVLSNGRWRFLERNIETWLGRDEDVVERLPQYRVVTPLATPGGASS
jgi:hypothetical protein